MFVFGTESRNLSETQVKDSVEAQEQGYVRLAVPSRKRGQNDGGRRQTVREGPGTALRERRAEAKRGMAVRGGEEASPPLKHPPTSKPAEPAVNRRALHYVGTTSCLSIAGLPACWVGEFEGEGPPPHPREPELRPLFAGPPVFLRVLRTWRTVFGCFDGPKP